MYKQIGKYTINILTIAYTEKWHFPPNAPGYTVFFNDNKNSLSLYGRDAEQLEATLYNLRTSA